MADSTELRSFLPSHTHSPLDAPAWAKILMKKHNVFKKHILVKLFPQIFCGKTRWTLFFHSSRLFTRARPCRIYRHNITTGDSIIQRTLFFFLISFLPLYYSQKNNGDSIFTSVCVGRRIWCLSWWFYDTRNCEKSCHQFPRQNECI